MICPIDVRLCLPPDNVQHELQRRSLINVLPQKEGNQAKPKMYTEINLHEFRLPSVPASGYYIADENTYHVPTTGARNRVGGSSPREPRDCPYGGGCFRDEAGGKAGASGASRAGGRNIEHGNEGEKAARLGRRGEEDSGTNRSAQKTVEIMNHPVERIG